MTFRILVAACLLLLGWSVGGEGISESVASIRSLVREARPAMGKSGEDDVEKRRKAALNAVQQAKIFLKEHPMAKEASDVHIDLNQALMLAALCDDTNSVEELKRRSREVIRDPSMSADIKEHVVIMNYYVEWGLKNGKRYVDEGSSEGRPVYCEAMFAAVEALPQKESILQQILLEAKSGLGLKPADARKIAERVGEHPAATEFLRTAARKFLAGEREFEVGKPLELKFTAMDGREVNLATMRGKVVLICFWATWCGPCVSEFAILKKTYDTWHEKGLEVIGISLDDEKRDLESFLKRNGPAPWPQYFDGKGWNTAVSWRFGINSVPTVWLVNKAGILDSTNASYDTAGMFYVEDHLKGR